MSTSDKLLIVQAVILLFTAVVVAWYTWETQKIRKDTAEQNRLFRIQQQKAIEAANQRAIFDLETTIGRVPSVLKFHGIEQDELEKAGVTAEECIRTHTVKKSTTLSQSVSMRHFKMKRAENIWKK